MSHELRRALPLLLTLAVVAGGCTQSPAGRVTLWNVSGGGTVFGDFWALDRACAEETDGCAIRRGCPSNVDVSSAGRLSVLRDGRVLATESPTTTGSYNFRLPDDLGNGEGLWRVEASGGVVPPFAIQTAMPALVEDIVMDDASGDLEISWNHDGSADSIVVDVLGADEQVQCLLGGGETGVTVDLSLFSSVPITVFVTAYGEGTDQNVLFRAGTGVGARVMP